MPTFPAAPGASPTTFALLPRLIQLGPCSCPAIRSERSLHAKSGCVWTCREAARRMVAAGAGSILVVGSTSLYTPAAREAAYRASKAALKAYAEVLALELALHGVRVNVLTPRAFRTPLTAHMSAEQRAELVREIPLRREGITDELCATALLLLSDRLSPYTTGAEFVVDGGLRLRPLSLETT